MWIESPEQAELAELAGALQTLSSQLDVQPEWPSAQLKLCAQAGVFRWFLPKSCGGDEWSTHDIMRGYLELSSACLTTTFILTQLTGAARRIAGCDNERLKQALLSPLAHGESFATVGISHLTTSRRHLKTPSLLATPSAGGFRLSGTAPWVTGASAAEWLVVGATLEDGRELLSAVRTEAAGVEVGDRAELVALTASCTGPVHFDNCYVSEEELLAGPVQEVMKQGVGANTGGVQTSTLAVGLARSAVAYLQEEAARRPDLDGPATALAHELESVEQDVLLSARGEPVCTTEVLRTRANSCALRSAQAALTAAKGAGFTVGHPAGRWCREALFFLVWSCPQPVMHANLCEMAGIA